jgi:hypothetical protein
MYDRKKRGGGLGEEEKEWRRTGVRQEDEDEREIEAVPEVRAVDLEPVLLHRSDFVQREP